MKKRLISLLLVLVTVFGLVPSTFAAGTEFTVDFMDFAEQAADQSWWSGLVDTNHSGIKAVGDKDNATSDTHKNAVIDLEDWLKKNTNWCIDDLTNGSAGWFTYPSGSAKQLYIDSDATHYGLRFYTEKPGGTINWSKLMFTVQVPASQAGVYNFSMEVYNEKVGSTAVPSVTGDDHGGARGDIYVNGDLLYEEYQFYSTTDGVATADLGRVVLNAGENQIMIWVTGNNKGGTAAGNSALNLRAFHFEPTVCDHEGMKTSTLVTDNGDGTHTTTVNCICKEILSEQDASCKDRDGDQVCDVCGAFLAQFPTEFGEDSIVMNFMQTAKDISTQSWWDDLRATDVDGIKAVGQPYQVGITTAQKAAVTSLDTYLKNNCNWTIPDLLAAGSTNYIGSYGSRILYFNTANNYYGIRFVTRVPSDSTGRHKLNLTVNVPAGKAGQYAMDMNVINEALNSRVKAAEQYDTSGGGVANIYVNDELVYEKYKFAATADTIETLNFGPVDLVSGTNTICIEVLTNRHDEVKGGRCAFSLRYIEFKPLDYVNVQENMTAYRRVKEYYLPFGAEQGEYSVEVDDRWIAKATIDTKGILAITGISAGETTVTVYDGKDVFRTIPVTVEPFDGTIDDLNGTPETMDFLDVIEQAQKQSFWSKLPNKYGEKSITAGDSFTKWLSSNAKWTVSGVSGTVLAHTDMMGLGVDGTATFTVQLPAAGVYGVRAVYVSGGGDMTVTANGTAVGDMIYTLFGDTDVVDCNLGSVAMNEGSNTVVLETMGEVWLQKLVFTPLGTVRTEEGIETYLDLGKTYVPYLEIPSSYNFTVESSDEETVTASINTNGQLVLQGVNRGDAVVTLTSKSSKSSYEIGVEVLEQSEAVEVEYTLNGETALVLEIGDTAEAALNVLTTNRTVLAEEYLRKKTTDATIYFESADSEVVTVDSETGDVTAVAEGTAMVTAYVEIDGKILCMGIPVTVTDVAALNGMSISTVADHVAVGGKLQLRANGTKTSGLPADMSKYTVLWSSSDKTVASVSETGLLTGLKEGTVTVTAKVDGTSFTSTVQISVVKDTELTEKAMFYRLTNGQHMDILTYTIDEQDIAINRDLTYKNGSTVKLTIRGLELEAPVGQQLAMDFRVKRSGWYRVVLGGSQEVDSCTAQSYLDDAYLGYFDYTVGGTNSATGGCNTVWLDAGVHTVRIVTETAGSQYLGGISLYPCTDPEPFDIQFTAADTDLLVGESTTWDLSILDSKNEYFTLLHQASVPDFTNYSMVTSSNTSILSVDGNTVTAKALGSADLILSGEINGKALEQKRVTVYVKSGEIASTKLRSSIDTTTVLPNADPFMLYTRCFAPNGREIYAPSGTETVLTSSNPSVVQVSGNTVTVGSKQGSARITAVTTEPTGHQTETSVWVIVTSGKTEPTVYTKEERAAAQENVKTYDWAKAELDSVLTRAELYVKNVDVFYETVMLPQTWPGNYYATYRGDEYYRVCPACNTDLVNYDGYYPWLVDPINLPWKIKCPHCSTMFPTNDFESYYKSGLGADGKFYVENADPQYLVNELYPEKGETWGVDDGWGWKLGTYDSDGTPRVYTFVSHFIRKSMEPFRTGTTNGFPEVMDCLGYAYLYTGDEKYGNAGAKLISRFADIYATYDISDWNLGTYNNNDGFGGGGVMFGCLSDGVASDDYARWADIFWPCLVNDEVVSYVADHAGWLGVTAADVTADFVRSHVEEDLLLKIWEFLQTNEINGNFGLPQAVCAYTAVALNRLPETQNMIDWLFAPRVETGTPMQSNTWATGGEVLDKLVNEVSRDGLGNEGSLSYNIGWCSSLMGVCDALAGYELVPSADLWKNSKLVTMVSLEGRLTTGGHMGVNLHETSGRYQTNGANPNLDRLTTAFIQTGNEMLAQQLYAYNGNTTAGLRGSIFTENPEEGVQEAVQKIVDEKGEWDTARSDMLPGFGLAILREGPAKYVKSENKAEYAQIWMFYGDTKGPHAHAEVLNLDLDAFGLNLSGNMGYSVQITSNIPRAQWDTNTISNNTVVVNDKGQFSIPEGGFPLHFSDGGYAKVMDASAPHVYAETDVYRRSVVQVDNGDGVHYSVDFFHVKGGEEHVYSFHAASMTDPATTGLDLTEQTVGTYAGADIPFGPWDPADLNETGFAEKSGYSWLYNVARDAQPSTKFSVDWPIVDFFDQTPAEDLHLKLTMLSDKPFAEVATADGQPPQTKSNPEHLEWLLVRNSGEDGLNTLYTTVLEPYQKTSYIADAELVDMFLVSGTEGINDMAKAVKVTLNSGRVDYVIYATNTECTYLVDNLITFRGFAGVISYENGEVVCAWADEAVQLEEVIKKAQPRVTGTVTDFTKELLDSNTSYTMTVTLDQTMDAEDLIDKWIYVDNDGSENAAYRIYGAEVSGKTAVLDLSFQTLIREYKHPTDLSMGYRYNISEGDTFRIPLSASYGLGEDEPNEPEIEVTQFAISGCAPNLESELEMNIVFPKASIHADLDFTATVTQTSGGEVVKTFVLDESQWGEYSSALYKVTMKMAAKCMADDFSIEITDQYGRVWNKPYTTSYRTYVTNNIGKTNVAARKTLFVDMLNYGAAAQQRFNYNVDDLANKNLTAAQQAYSLAGTVSLTNKQVMGKYNLGSTVSLESKILVYSVFRGLNDAENMYAVVTYTDARGNEKTINIPGTEFELYNASAKAYKICVNTLVPADVDCAYTMTVYNADGTVYDTATEGLGSYLTRNISKDTVFGATINFGMAAKQFFVG